MFCWTYAIRGSVLFEFRCWTFYGGETVPGEDNIFQLIINNSYVLERFIKYFQ